MLCKTFEESCPSISFVITGTLFKLQNLKAINKLHALCYIIPSSFLLRCLHLINENQFL